MFARYCNAPFFRSTKNYKKLYGQVDLYVEGEVTGVCQGKQSATVYFPALLQSFEFVFRWFKQRYNSRKHLMNAQNCLSLELFMEKEKKKALRLVCVNSDVASSAQKTSKIVMVNASAKTYDSMVGLDYFCPMVSS